jgi:cysteine desulfuration protein SufE
MIVSTVYASCLEKQDKVKALFAECKTPADLYDKIMELGKKLEPFPPESKTDHNRVKGCQSQMFLLSRFENGKVHFEADSDALISRGLAALLLMVYSDESPEAILKCPPTYLEDLGIATSLSPTRSNGLFSLHLQMKQEALRFLLQKNA